MRLVAGLKPKAPAYGGWNGGGSGMDACQKARGSGGLWAWAEDRDWYADLGRGTVRPEETTPWYTTHKILAGLRDADLVAENIEARDVLVRMADWRVAVTSGLTDDQFQHMLGDPGTMGEFGGPHEVPADVYAVPGDRKYLTLAERFKHRVIFDPPARGDASVLTGEHANTEILKFVGYERIYQLTGDKPYEDAARNFWEDVTANRSWANDRADGGEAV